MRTNELDKYGDGCYLKNDNGDIGRQLNDS